MVDLVNVLLRGLMCIAFIMWVVRPMLMTFSRRELDQAEIEETAQMAITSAFQAYTNNNTKYSSDPPHRGLILIIRTTRKNITRKIFLTCIFRYN